MITNHRTYEVVRISSTTKEALVVRLALTKPGKRNIGPPQSPGQCPSWAWIVEQKLIALLNVFVTISSLTSSVSFTLTWGRTTSCGFSSENCIQVRKGQWLNINDEYQVSKNLTYGFHAITRVLIISFVILKSQHSRALFLRQKITEHQYNGEPIIQSQPKMEDEMHLIQRPHTRREKKFFKEPDIDQCMPFFAIFIREACEISCLSLLMKKLRKKKLYLYIDFLQLYWTTYKMWKENHMANCQNYHI